MPGTHHPGEGDAVSTCRHTDVVAVLALISAAAGVNAGDASAVTPTFNGTVAANGTVQQTFGFSVSSPGRVTATLSWSQKSAVLTLAIVDPWGKQVALNSTNANPKTVTYDATLTGTYKVRVKAKSGSSDFTGIVHYPGVSVPQFAGLIGGGGLRAIRRSTRPASRSALTARSMSPTPATTR